MRFGKALYDGKPQPRAAVGGGDVVAAAAKALESVGLILRRDADAGILHPEGEAAIRFACAQTPSPARRPA